MKKNLLFIMGASAIMFASCQKNVVPEGQGSGEVTFTIGASAGDVLGTRAVGTDANSRMGGVTNVDWSAYDLRYILEIYSSDGATLLKERMVETYADAYSDAKFTVRMAPDEYKFVLWADFVATGTQTDLHYNTETGLKAIEMMGTYAVNDESRDAYFAAKNVTVSTSNGSASITLKRPFGKIRLVTDDIADLTAGIEPKVVNVTYFVDLPAAFDAVTGAVSGTLANGPTYTAAVEDYKLDYDADAAYQTLFVDYIFGTATESPLKFKIEVYSDADATVLIKEREFLTDIPIKRNMLTTLLGSVLTTNTTLTVVVDENFEDTKTILQNMTVAEISEALDANGVLYDIIEKLTVTNEVAADATIKIPAATDGGALAFDFSGGIAAGTAVSIVDETPTASDYDGVVSIYTKAGTAGNLTVTLPAATVRIYNDLGMLVSETAPGTLFIEKTASVAELTIVGGNVNILGTVGDIAVTAADDVIVNVGVDGDITGTATNNGNAKFFWAAATGQKLRYILERPAACNHGAILTADVNFGIPVGGSYEGAQYGSTPTQYAFLIGSAGYDTANTDTDPHGAAPYDAYNGYVFDGKGFSLSGYSYNNVLQVGANNVTIKNLTVAQSESDRSNSRGGGNNGITFFQSLGGKLENVTVTNCGKAGVVVNNAQVTAKGLTTSGNVWGGVNVSYGSSLAGGIGVEPTFEFDGTSVFNEASEVWVDIKAGAATKDRWQVTPPISWSSYTNTKGQVVYCSTPEKALAGGAAIIGNTVYSTIGDAIAAAVGGDHILLGAATYANTGGMVINNDLTITGTAGTVIMVNTPQERTFGVTTTAPANTGNYPALFITAGTVDISNVTISTKITPVGKLVDGITIETGTLRLTDVTFDGILPSEFTGVQTGRCVIALAASEVEVKDCTFKKFNKNGIHMFDNTSLTVDGCSFTGRGTTTQGLAGQNGVVFIGNDASGTVKNSSFTNFTDYTDGSCGILIYNVTNGGANVNYETPGNGNSYSGNDTDTSVYATTP